MKVRCQKILSYGSARKNLSGESDSLIIGKEYVVLGIFLFGKCDIFYRLEPDLMI